MQKWLKTPYFGGHAAKDYCGNLGSWAYDEEAPLPDGVEVHRHTHAPVYAGVKAVKIIEELRRRAGLKGKATSETHYAFSGLLMCGTCGCTLVANPNNGYPNWRCQTRQRNPTCTLCEEKRMISDVNVRKYVTALLTQLVEHGSSEMLNATACS